MENRKTSYKLFALILLLANCPTKVQPISSQGWGGIQPVPSENECKPFIDKALKERDSTGLDESENLNIVPSDDISEQNEPTGSEDQIYNQETDAEKDSTESTEQEIEESIENNLDKTNSENVDSKETDTAESKELDETKEEIDDNEKKESNEESKIEGEDETNEDTAEDTVETVLESNEEDNVKSQENESGEQSQEDVKSVEKNDDEQTEEDTDIKQSEENKDDEQSDEGEAGEKSQENEDSADESDTLKNKQESIENVEKAETDRITEKEGEENEEDESKNISDEKSKVDDELSQNTDEGEETENTTESVEEKEQEQEEIETVEDNKTSSEIKEDKSEEEDKIDSAEAITAEEIDLDKNAENEQKDEADTKEDTNSNDESVETKFDEQSSKSDEVETEVNEIEQKSSKESEEKNTEDEEKENIKPEEEINEKSKEDTSQLDENIGTLITSADDSQEEKDETKKEQDSTSPEEEDLILDFEIPNNLRPKHHIAEILKLGEETKEVENLLSKTTELTLRELKRLYESAIKPLEVLYKYRDLSNRHFGDSEVFSKPLILFMGPWSGGKSTIINYLVDNEYKKSALRTGAEPSPAYFNIVMWGEREEILDGTQLAADWTFSGLQKFGQGLLDRLRGLKLNHPLLEKVNIVEIPGILEIRKQVERLFPFNDACQWFIDRADIIFLVYDPSKLDVGPETEAILDQLKGREYQTRIILNKADQVKPEELMRVQGTLIWNISPLMSSTEPPIMYSTSLWSVPYEIGSPSRLLFAQERAFLKDLKDAVDKRVENKIASARRFAVRVRNHAKMVDCYLTTYYNHKSFFGNKKKISDDIIEHPQNYHIYEGLSTLTNISRYDLPDPDVYKDFFRLNPIYDFQQLSATCTYFRGCPINRLDVAIAYDLPELVGKYKKTAEEVLEMSKKSKTKV